MPERPGSAAPLGPDNVVPTFGLVGLLGVRSGIDFSEARNNRATEGRLGGAALRNLTAVIKRGNTGRPDTWVKALREALSGVTPGESTGRESTNRRPGR